MTLHGAITKGVAYLTKKFSLKSVLDYLKIDNNIRLNNRNKFSIASSVVFNKQSNNLGKKTHLTTN